jgi:hypothetical protein
LVGFARSITNMASDLRDASDITGLGTDALQALDMVARESGGGIEKLRKGLINLRIAQDDAGNKATAEAFERVGVSAEQLAGSSMPELIESLAKVYAETRNLGAISDIVGKENIVGLEQALLRVADGGLPALIEQGKELGLVLDKKVGERADMAGEKLDRLYTRLKAGAANFLSGAIDGLNMIGEGLGNVIADIGDEDFSFGASFGQGVTAWQKENKKIEDGILAQKKAVEDLMAARRLAQLEESRRQTEIREAMAEWERATDAMLRKEDEMMQKERALASARADMPAMMEETSAGLSAALARYSLDMSGNGSINEERRQTSFLERITKAVEGPSEDPLLTAEIY